MRRTRAFGAVVVAAGSGNRLGGAVPKALRELAGRPLVVHAVQTLRCAGADSVVVVVPADHRAAFEAALAETDVQLVIGGTERQDSVRVGLKLLARHRAPAGEKLGRGDQIVLVHDAARPLTPVTVVERVCEAVAAGAAAVVPAIPVVDTIRRLSADGSELVDRSSLRAVQTPQGFDLAVLLAAHQGNGSFAVTDDAGICERAGVPITVVDGSIESIKITVPLDLLLAEAILTARADGRDQR